MKKIIYFLLLFTIYSCNLSTTGVNVSVTNNSDRSIKNVKCYTSEEKDVLTFASVNPSEEKVGYLSMKKNKTDGHYILELTTEKGKSVKHIDSYYSNGKPSSQTIIFEIQNDTVICSTK
ncbi:MAG: hypothetical protein EOO46_05720 [Flavobacterium sp.]|nr:MAG: hypothetical protein EOO46_05720 [Flavobacterium sp.]